MSTAAVALLTAEEFLLLPDDGRPAELVRGRVVERNIPAPRHGYFCSQIGRLLGNFVEAHDLGRVMSNDAAVVTEHDPDTVRGPDVSYYSYARLPRGPLPAGYLPVVPELAFEVRSPTDRWSEIVVKVGEFLNAGVSVVCVLDPQTETLTVYHAEQPTQVLRADDELTLPDLLTPEFRLPVRRLFE
jgi:Uma2 family endonuclease